MCAVIFLAFRPKTKLHDLAGERRTYYLFLTLIGDYNARIDIVDLLRICNF